jgi:hypothetical protein
MAEQFVGKASEIKDGDRRIVFMGSGGVFKEKDSPTAISALPGWPSLRRVLAKVEERIMPDKTSRRHAAELHFICRHGEPKSMRLRP